jgi:hypothetical protein
MSEDLFEVLESDEFEKYGSLEFTGAYIEDFNFYLNACIDFHDSLPDENIQHWKIVCEDEREHRLILGNQGYLTLEDNHVLLWPFRERKIALFFHGSVDDSSALVFELFKQHYDCVGEWFPFKRFINSLYTNLTELIEGRYGSLAEGPEPLIYGYEKVLVEFGVQTSIINRLQKYWNGSEWVPGPEDVKLLITDQSYVICSEVKTYRTEKVDDGHSTP